MVMMAMTTTTNTNTTTTSDETIHLFDNLHSSSTSDATNTQVRSRRLTPRTRGTNSSQLPQRLRLVDQEMKVETKTKLPVHMNSNDDGCEMEMNMDTKSKATTASAVSSAKIIANAIFYTTNSKNNNRRKHSKKILIFSERNLFRKCFLFLSSSCTVMMMVCLLFNLSLEYGLTTADSSGMVQAAAAAAATVSNVVSMDDVYMGETALEDDYHYTHDTTDTNGYYDDFDNENDEYLHDDNDNDNDNNDNDDNNEQDVQHPASFPRGVTATSAAPPSRPTNTNAQRAWRNQPPQPAKPLPPLYIDGNERKKNVDDTTTTNNRKSKSPKSIQNAKTMKLEKHTTSHHKDDSIHTNAVTAPLPSSAADDSSLRELPIQPNEDFVSWCQEVLGVETMLEIQIFEYYDYIQAMEDRIDIFCEDCMPTNVAPVTAQQQQEDGSDFFFFDDDVVSASSSSYMTDDDYDEEYWTNPDLACSVEDYPRISVRGLAATKEIKKGDVVLRIPHKALWTITNQIDHHPILSEILGPEARARHGWDLLYIYEIPLLTIALLYHLKETELATTDVNDNVMNSRSDNNGKNNNDDDDDTIIDYRPYLSLLEETPGIDAFPHLWSAAKLRRAAPVGVRKVAKAIQRDVQELYQGMMEQVLIQEYPEIFGKPHGDNENGYDDDDGWMFSFERFHWAFALVNSRHWHLPIPPTAEAAAAAGASTITDDGSVDLSQKHKGQEKRHHVSSSSSGTTDTNVDSATTLTTTDDEPTIPVDSPSAGTFFGTETGDSETAHFSEQAAPPAAMPTDEWLYLQRQEQRKEEEESYVGDTATATTTTSQTNPTDNDKSNGNDTTPPKQQERQQLPLQPSDVETKAGNDVNIPQNWPSGNSFLAPLADLLNFGPPCTRGIYNVTTESFEIIATCDFRPGQEVTFWYADACQDVFVANYGFTHPMMVPPCASPDQKKEEKDHVTIRKEQQRRIFLEQELTLALDTLDKVDGELDAVLHAISDCDCTDKEEILLRHRQQYQEQTAGKNNDNEKQQNEDNGNDFIDSTGNDHGIGLQGSNNNHQKVQGQEEEEDNNRKEQQRQQQQQQQSEEVEDDDELGQQQGQEQPGQHHARHAIRGSHRVRSPKDTNNGHLNRGSTTTTTTTVAKTPRGNSRKSDL